MQLSRLDYVLAVIDHGGVSRAAAALGVTQPSVSQAIQRLESDLGVALFERVGRRLQITEAGRAIEGPARDVQRAVADIGDLARQHRDTLTGTVRVAALPTIAASVVADAIGALHERAPEIRVVVHDEPRPAGVIDMVADGRCDLAFSERPTVRAGLVSTSLADQELMVVAPPGTPASAWPVQRLAEVPLILPPPGTSTRDLLEQLAEEHGVMLRVSVEISRREAIVPLVLAGVGAAVLPDRLALRVRALGVVVASLRPRLMRTVAVTHRDRGLSAAAELLLEVAAQGRSAAGPVAGLGPPRKRP